MNDTQIQTINRPGWQTTEFWLSLAAIVCGALINSGLLPEAHPAAQVVGMIAVILGALGYTGGRVAIKRAAAAVVRPNAVSKSNPDRTPPPTNPALE